MTLTVTTAPLQASWFSVALSLKVRVPVPTDVVAPAATRVLDVSAVAVNHPGRQPALSVETVGVSHRP